MSEGKKSGAAWAYPVAAGVARLGRLAARLLPAGVKKRVEDRIFYAVFQVTRVENDAYGWRPPPPGGAEPPPGR